MVENPANAMASGLASAQAVDSEVKTRLSELARRGKDDPSGLAAEDIRELCASVLTLLDESSS